MKKVILYGLGFIIAAVIIAVIVAPKEEIVERSITIDKPVAEVYEYFALLQNMEAWSPWAKKDPKATHKYEGAGNTVGSVHYWNSTHEEVGVGEQEIVSLVPNQEIYSELRFIEPFESTYGAVESVIMLLMDMDKMIGGDFEQGLGDAKAILEK